MSLRQWPGAEETYLRRLNKTSLCQTIQGMAGHSLCGVDGGEGEEGGVKRKVRGGEGGGGGWRKRDGGVRGREGQQCESHMAGLSYDTVR